MPLRALQALVDILVSDNAKHKTTRPIFYLVAGMMVMYWGSHTFPTNEAFKDLEAKMDKRLERMEQKLDQHMNATRYPLLKAPATPVLPHPQADESYPFTMDKLLPSQIATGTARVP